MENILNKNKLFFFCKMKKVKIKIKPIISEITFIGITMTATRKSAMAKDIKK